MLLNRFLLLLTGVLLSSISTLAVADGPAQIEQDEALLKQAGLKVDDSGLLAFFKKRTLDENDLEKVQKLLRQLGARAFRAREDAAAELIARGPEVVGLLKECIKDGDPEIVRRAGFCLQRIQEKDVSTVVVVAAAHLLAARKTPGTVETLLAFLPSVEKDRVAEAICRALTVMAVRDGKTDRTLVAALTDKFPVRRSAAAQALVRAGVKEAKEAVRKLLADPDPAVRIRVALVLAHAQDPDAIPVLIRLLNQLPQTMASQAEEILYRLAIGQSPPMVPLGHTPETQKNAATPGKPGGRTTRTK